MSTETTDTKSDSKLSMQNVFTNLPSKSQYNIMDPESIRIYMENNNIEAPEITGSFGASFLVNSPRVMASLAERVILAMRFMHFEVPVDLERVYRISLDTSAEAMEGDGMLIDDDDAKIIAAMETLSIRDLVHVVSVFMDESTIGMENEVAEFETALGMVEDGEEEDEEESGTVE